MILTLMIVSVDKLRNLKLCFSPSRHVIDQGLNQITMTVEHKDAKALLARCSLGLFCE